MEMTAQITKQGWVERLGAIGWVFGVVQFFVCHLIVQWAWPTPYSWALNNVSDLGNVYCQPWGDNARYVCSPLHDLMNASFIAEGLLMIVGLTLVRSLWGRGCLAHISRGFLVLTGLSFILVGLVPADVDENLHVVLGAFVITLIGNSGLILAGVTSNANHPWWVRVLGPLIGAIGLVATVLFFSGNDLELGMGGMERFAVFNLLAWTLIVGIWVSIRRDRRMG